jgi:hypothetical protein
LNLNPPRPSLFKGGRRKRSAFGRIPSLEKGGLGRVLSQHKPTLEIEPSPSPQMNPPRPSLFKGGRRKSSALARIPSLEKGGRRRALFAVRLAR